MVLLLVVSTAVAWEDEDEIVDLELDAIVVEGEAGGEKQNSKRQFASDRPSKTFVVPGL